MIFTLRTYGPGDFETLYEIDRRCFSEGIAYSKRELRSYLRFPSVECVLALKGRKRTAAAFGFCIAVHSHGCGHIVTMDVLPQFRRRGVAGKLLAEAERRLAAAKVTQVALETATTNDSAIAFWEKHGYRKQGIHEEYYPSGENAWEMTKYLSRSFRKL